MSTMPEFLKDAIDELQSQYPGQFDSLSTVEYEENDDRMLIAYNHEDNIVYYGSDLEEHLSNVKGCLAFTSYLISDSDFYCNVPEGHDRHIWNMATHIHITDKMLADHPEMKMPDEAIQNHIEIPAYSSLEELYDKFIEMKIDNILD